MIVLKAKYLKNSLQKTVGLIGEKHPQTVYLNTRFGIHTFGVGFPIDVLVLSRENNIVKVKENMQPNNVFFWNPVYDKIVEMPAGDVKKNKIKNGELVKLVLDHSLEG